MQAEEQPITAVAASGVENVIDVLRTESQKASSFAVELIQDGLEFPAVNPTEEDLAQWRLDYKAADDCYNELHRLWKAGEKQRVDMTQPLNDHMKKINNAFKSRLDPIDAAKRALKAKMENGLRKEFAWKKFEEERKLAEAIKLQEDEAIARAATQEKLGNSDQAERIISTPAAPPKIDVPTMSTAGKTASSFKWSAKLVSKMDFLKAVVAGDVDSSLVEIDESYVRRVVAASNGKTTFPGFQNFEDFQIRASGRQP